MFFKVSLAFLVFGCFLTFNHAWVRGYQKYENTLSTGTGKSFKEFTYEIEKSFKELTKNLDWIYHLVSFFKSGLDYGFETITRWPVELMLRVEFFTMADGSHFVFPITGNYEKEKHYKAVAIAVSNLTMSLQTMERVDKVLKNATKILASKDYGQSHYKSHEKSEEKILGGLLHEYFEIVEQQIQADEVLQEVYRQRLHEARKTVEIDSRMDGPLDKIWEDYRASKYVDLEEVKRFFKNKGTFHRAIVNKVFMKQSVKYFSMIFRPEQHKRYLLARAMIVKAVDSTYGESKIDDVYQQVLMKVGEEYAASGEFGTIREYLFKYLQEVLESDPTLYSEVKSSMKQIEHTSAYDSNMYTDFSIL